MNNVTMSAAIIIGIDAYAAQPLTSAVNDARLFRQALVDLRLVGPEDIHQITAPSENGGDLPTRRGILDALRPYYTGEKSVGRLFVYYAGHGLLAFADPAHTLARTALVPVDVRDLATDGDTLIDLDSVLQRLRFSGPAEQFFFIDACRDLAYDEHPDTTTALGWRAAQPGPERRQAILYAVPPLGRARGQRDGLGIMTRHLVDALHGRGMALDYSDDLRRYVVSPESVAAYVHNRVLETVGAVPLWQRNYVLPRLDHREPKTGPIRQIDQPDDVSLTVYVHPQEAENATHVKLTQMETPVCSWPPNRYRQAFTVRPRRYWLEAESDVGTAEPAQLRIDAREEHEATIEIRPTSRTTPGPRLSAEPGPSAPHLETTPDTSYPVASPPHGTVVAEALEPQATVELEQIDPPYHRWASPHRLDRAVPPGAYRIRFRLGLDIYSESEIEVRARTVVKVTPTIGTSPLIQQVLGEHEPPTRAGFSETMGPIQAGVLPTVLPIIGIKPFDLTHQLFRRFNGVVPEFDPNTFGLRPVSVVLAIDGNRWPVEASEVLRSTRVTAERAGPPVEFPIAPLLAGYGDGRIGLGIIAAPARSFTIRAQSPYIGSIMLAAASLPTRATVITLTFKPDGSFDVGQNLLRIPGQKYQELVTHVPYARMLRELQLGQKLYESGELAERERLESSELLTELLYAKWTDPILSCMAYFAWSDARLPDSNLLAATSDNLLHYFEDLPDSRVIHGLAVPAERDQTLSDMIDTSELPVLARSAAELARYAHEQGRDNHPVVALSRRVTLRQPWLMNWQAGEQDAIQQLVIT
jgi:uncharacterized caspase-like protein